MSCHGWWWRAGVSCHWRAGVSCRGGWGGGPVCLVMCCFMSAPTPGRGHHIFTPPPAPPPGLNQLTGELMAVKVQELVGKHGSSQMNTQMTELKQVGGRGRGRGRGEGAGQSAHQGLQRVQGWVQGLQGAQGWVQGA